MGRKVFIRIRKRAKDRYLIEERHTFMFFWRFWVKGSIKLKLPKYFASNKIAEQAIMKTAERKGIKPFIVMLDK
jgi:hypothetical protein